MIIFLAKFEPLISQRNNVITVTAPSLAEETNDFKHILVQPTKLPFMRFGGIMDDTFREFAGETRVGGELSMYL